MGIYIFFGSLGYFFSLLELAINKKNNNEKIFLYFGYIFFSVLLILLQGCRGEVGHDYYAYKNFYESSNVMYSNFEIGFKYLVMFFKMLNLEYNSFQFIISIFTGLIFYSFIYKNTKYPIFFLYIYFCVFFFPVNFSQIRQQIAICILMLFSLLNKNNSKIITFIGLIFASLFHRTCLILLLVPMIEILIRKKNKMVLCFLFLFAISIVFYAKSIVFYAKSIFNCLIIILSKCTFLPYEILNKANYYTEGMNRVGIGAGVYASFLLCLLIIIFSDKDYQNVLFFLIAFLFDKAGFLVVVIQRFAYYFYLNKLGLASYSNIVDNKIIKKTKILAIFLLLTYFFLILIKYLNDVGSYIVPYKIF